MHSINVQQPYQYLARDINMYNLLQQNELFIKNILQLL